MSLGFITHNHNAGGEIMKFPNVADGVKKIYTAEILSLIASICGFVALVLGIFAIASAALADSFVGVLAGGIGAAVLGIAVLVLLLISFILGIVGVNRASKDEDESGKHYFKLAFYMIIGAIVLSLVSGALSSNATVRAFIDAISSGIQLATTCLIIYGIRDFAEKINDTELVAKAKNVITFLVASQVLAIITKALSDILKSTVTTAISIVLAVASLIFSIIYYVLYLKLLSTAKKTFEKA